MEGSPRILFPFYHIEKSKDKRKYILYFQSRYSNLITDQLSMIVIYCIYIMCLSRNPPYVFEAHY